MWTSESVRAWRAFALGRRVRLGEASRAGRLPGAIARRIAAFALVPEPTVWVIPTFVIVRRSHSP